jgi:hypothetical protein
MNDQDNIIGIRKMILKSLVLASVMFSTVSLANDIYVPVEGNQTCVHDVVDKKISCFKEEDDGSFVITREQLDILKSMPQVDIEVDFTIVADSAYYEFSDAAQAGSGNGSGNGNASNNASGNASNNGSGNASNNGSGNTIIIAMPGSTVIIGKGGKPRPQKKDKDSGD